MTEPQSEQSHVEWGTAYSQGEGEDFSQLLSPFPQSPSSSWRSGAGSDVSSIRSASPSPSGYGLSSPHLHSPNPDSFPSRFGGGSPDPPHYGFHLNSGFEPHSPDESPAFRGRLERRGGQHKLPSLQVPGSPLGDLIKFEDLSLGSTEQYYPDYDLFTDQSTYSAEASGSHSAGLSPPLPFQSYDHDPFLHLSDAASIRSTSSLSSNYNPFPHPDDGSSTAGRSRSDSHASHNGDNRRQTRAQRRRDHSPYPVVESSTSPPDATYWPEGFVHLIAAEYLSAHNLPDSADFVAPSTSSSVADGASSTSASRRDPSAHDASLYRSVATDATVIASKNRRREPTKRGKFICHLCGNDFTAKHNLKNHVNSHNSVKDFGCKDCGQFFGTPHVLKRHRDKCKSIMVKGIAEPPM
ncbi:hypothetical protein B0H16DRAFT_716205 [Mycena metata]|uniref:C2H2-type domain-containing protein n=1 Tax=Mycena metata TaxID=1033252 RepID=A0AAD7NCV6_9AGAR|nr:hypothetical protein B0H16DRAFT_716205 [Mycena metata]